MNHCEDRIQKALIADGWSVLRNGWPDFLCWRDHDGGRKVMCVEVKDKNTGDKLRETQIMNHALLTGIGLPVYVLDKPDISNMDTATSVQVVQAETLARLEERRDAFARVLEKSEQSYIASRQAILEKMVGSLDVRYAAHMERAQNALKKFSEIEQALRTVHIKHEGAYLQAERKGAKSGR